MSAALSAFLHSPAWRPLALSAVFAAGDFAETFLRLPTDDYHLGEMRALILKHRGKLDDARREIEAALKHDPENRQGQRLRMEILRLLKKQEGR